MADEKKRNPKRKADELGSSNSSNGPPEKKRDPGEGKSLPPSSAAASSVSPTGPSAFAPLFAPPREKKSPSNDYVPDLRVQEALMKRKNMSAEQRSASAQKMFDTILDYYADKIDREQCRDSLEEQLMLGASPHAIVPSSAERMARIDEIEPTPEFLKKVLGKNIFNWVLASGTLHNNIEFLFVKYADPEIIKQHLQGDMPLSHIFAARHNFDVVRFLENVHKADLKARDAEGKSILHHAVNAGKGAVASAQMVPYLIKRGLGVNDRDKKANAPLHMLSAERLALEDGFVFEDGQGYFLNMIVPLILAGADLTLKNSDGRIPLQRQEKGDEKNNPSYLGLMLEVFPEQIATQDERNACQAMKIILATPGAKGLISEADGNPFLYIQVGEIAEELLKLGINPNFVTPGGKTIFYDRSIEVLRVLFAHPSRVTVDINRKNDFGHTALFHCHSLEACQTLVEHGADTSVKNSFGSTPLHTCVSQNYIEIEHIKIFEYLSQYIDPTLQNSFKETALHVLFARMLENTLSVGSGKNISLSAFYQSLKLIPKMERSITVTDRNDDTVLDIANEAMQAIEGAVQSKAFSPEKLDTLHQFHRFWQETCSFLQRYLGTLECLDILALGPPGASAAIEEMSRRDAKVSLKAVTLPSIPSEPMVKDPARSHPPEQPVLYWLVANHPQHLAVLPEREKTPETYMFLLHQAAIQGGELGERLARETIALIKSPQYSSSSCNVDIVTLSGMSALAFAAMFGHDKIVGLLIDEGANFDAAISSASCLPDSCIGADSFVTPLGLAAYYGHVEVVRLLLTRAKMKQLDIVNTITGAPFITVTPLMLAGQGGNLAVLQLLLGEVLLEVDARVEDGPTALACATGRAVFYPSEDCLTCVALLIRAGASPNIVYQDTTLSAAIMISDIPIRYRKTIRSEQYFSRTAMRGGLISYFADLQKSLLTPLENSLQRLLSDQTTFKLIEDVLREEVVFPAGYKFNSPLVGDAELTHAMALRKLLDKLQKLLSGERTFKLIEDVLQKEGVFSSSDQFASPPAGMTLAMTFRELLGRIMVRVGDAYKEDLEKLIRTKAGGAKKPLTEQQSAMVCDIMSQLKEMEEESLKPDEKRFNKIGATLPKVGVFSSAPQSSLVSEGEEGTLDLDETLEEAAGAKSAREFVQRLPIG